MASLSTHSEGVGLRYDESVRTIHVNTETSKYSIHLGFNAISTLRKHQKTLFPERNSAPVIITSPEIWALWATRINALFADRPAVLFLPAGERYKRLAQVEALAVQLSAAGADRKTTLLALGGGVVGDVTGFLAAIYMRGIDYIQIPTTFLSQVDSSVGGKTGVNLKSGKNLIGAFYPPKAVLIDTQFLKTLPESELRAGLFESIKAGLIRDRALFKVMEKGRTRIFAGDAAMIERVIYASVRMKARIVGEDERESGLRMILNFGHTIGHALEAVAGYGSLLHGEAVGWGMIAALAISHMRGFGEKDHASATGMILSYGLPALPKLSVEELVAATRRDKKTSGGTRHFVLLADLGNAYVTTDVTDDEIRAGIDAMYKLAAHA